MLRVLAEKKLDEKDRLNEYRPFANVEIFRQCKTGEKSWEDKQYYPYIILIVYVQQSSGTFSELFPP